MVTKKVAQFRFGAVPRFLPYAERVRVRALQDPVGHNFPYSFDSEILSTKPIPKPNGYTLYQKPGFVNNTQGIFEIGVTKDGIIDHRTFRKTKP